MTFEQLGLSAPLLRAVASEGYSNATPIQVKAIPPALLGRDVLGCAQTGTGKTAAFALPSLQRLGRATGRIRCLVLTPTRELATQVADSFGAYGRHTGLRGTVVFGGVGQGNQVAALRRGTDVLVATPGRLLDLIGQRLVSLASVEILVLDEADRMLDMGFIRDVKRIIAALPKHRQTLFFSATLPAEIQSLVDSILVNPVRVQASPTATTVELVEQRVYLVDTQDKRALLVHLLGDPQVRRALVFTRTKSGANRLARHLSDSRIIAEAIHGNKSQNARERALDGFKSGRTRVLVATDVASRGIDVQDVSHVVNFDVPNVPETYVHRIGRTGRAGASGVALSLCDSGERPWLRDIERTIRRSVAVAEHPFRAPAPGMKTTVSKRANTESSSSSSRPDAGNGGARSQAARGGRQRRERRALHRWY